MNKAKRINKVIELLEAGQPVYCMNATDVSYEGGKALANTWADWIRVVMEHHGFDLLALEAFMTGLADGGPTRSGHRTPTVTVELPVEGYSTLEIQANAWMFKQVLGTGVHGILLCHAEEPAAVGAFVELCRYGVNARQTEAGSRLGRRGSGGEVFAAPIWGITSREYQSIADTWPINPQGEILLGIKIESRSAAGIADQLARVPGIAFAEWGPGDMTLSFGHLDAHNPPYPEEVMEARAQVMRACKAAGLVFLHGVDEQTVVELIEEGVHMCDPEPANAEAIAGIGRAHTGRTMAV